jgi:hypothetical protein
LEFWRVVSREEKSLRIYRIRGMINFELFNQNLEFFLD